MILFSLVQQCRTQHLYFDRIRTFAYRKDSTTILVSVAAPIKSITFFVLSISKLGLPSLMTLAPLTLD